MPEWTVGVDRVVITSALSFASQVATFFQVGHDPLNCAFGDPDAFSHNTKQDGRFLSDAEQDVCMIAEKRPLGALGRLLQFLISASEITALRATITLLDSVT